MTKFVQKACEPGTLESSVPGYEETHNSLTALMQVIDLVRLTRILVIQPGSHFTLGPISARELSDRVSCPVRIRHLARSFTGCARFT